MALLGPFVLTRFDLYAATLTLAAVCAILYRRRVLGPVLLGVAIATKIYPAVLLPLLVARTWRREGRPAALTALALSVGTSLLIYLPFAIVAPEGVVRSVWRQLGRPLQIESLGSGVLLALHHALGMPLGWASGSGSQNLTGTVAAAASAVTTIVGVAALLLVWVRYARGDAESDARFVRYAAAAVVAFVAFGKVVSPQFLIWLLAIVVLVPGARGIAAIDAARRRVRAHAALVPERLLGPREAVRSNSLVARARRATWCSSPSSPPSSCGAAGRIRARELEAA